MITVRAGDLTMDSEILMEISLALNLTENSIHGMSLTVILATVRKIHFLE